jgi:hypothetical protein
LVTAWEMTAWRFSASSSISFSCSTISPSIFAVSRSRTAMMLVALSGLELQLWSYLLARCQVFHRCCRYVHGTDKAERRGVCILQKPRLHGVGGSHTTHALI